MKTKKISKPAEVGDNDVEAIKKAIMRYLYDELYKPLLEKIPAVNRNNIQNSRGDALAAIKTGKIVFHRGQFKGTFTAAISRGLKSLGAEWDSNTRTWKIPLYSLPEDYRTEIKTADIKYATASADVLDRISQVTHDFKAKSVDFTKYYDTAIFKMDAKITQQIDAVTVAPQLTEDELKAISAKYSKNLDLYVKDFTEEQILDLRKKIEKNFYSGNRYENLVETIKRSYGVSDNKARFLARQETKLLTAEYHEQRFTQAGSQTYVWRCVAGSPKHPVRPAHKMLDGKTINWNTPPVVDPKTGRKAHAGMDFGCRCTKEVIFKFS